MVDISSKSLRMEVAVMPLVKLHIFAFVPVKRATKFYVVSTIKVFHHNNKIKQSDSLLKICVFLKTLVVDIWSI